MRNTRHRIRHLGSLRFDMRGRSGFLTPPFDVDAFAKKGGLHNHKRRRQRKTVTQIERVERAIHVGEILPGILGCPAAR